MKIKGFTGKVWLRYLLQDSDLEKATSTVAAIYADDQRRCDWPTTEIAKLGRAIKIYRTGKEGSTNVGDIHHSVGFKTYGYSAEMEYANPIELSQKLIDFELSRLRYSDLSIGAPYHSPSYTIHVLPAELEQLNQPWSIYTAWQITKQESDTQPSYTLTISIPGTTTNPKALEELQSLCDTLYLPTYEGDGIWNSPVPHGSHGGYMPDITLAKKFYGDFTKESEEPLRELYEKVKDAVLRYKISENFKSGERTTSWSEDVQRAYRLPLGAGTYHRSVMAEFISASTLSNQVAMYAPIARVRLTIPDEKPYPRYVYLGENSYGVADIVDVLEVDASPEYLEPSTMAINGYIWPGENTLKKGVDTTIVL
ncbi:MAG: hypothetical protein A3D57_01785 [Candidatus Sungbacteria bacterium RIFCSPHIGHO2_02_FULL_46_12]|nr:MAG: hypothetical protein A3D57_01785 [Candidatus Sungbacteria bacterium RIFCSPHIGHO2_02_FULL_46_12]